MNHLRSFTALLGLMLLISPSVGAEKTVQEQLTELQLQMATLTRQMSDILKLQTFSRDMEEIKGRLRRLEEMMSKPPQVSTSQKPSLGRIQLKNDTDTLATITVNAQSYTLNPGEMRYLDDFPAGRFTYQVETMSHGLIKGRTIRDLRIGDTYLIRVY